MRCKVDGCNEFIFSAMRLNCSGFLYECCTKHVNELNKATEKPWKEWRDLAFQLDMLTIKAKREDVDFEDVRELVARMDIAAEIVTAAATEWLAERARPQERSATTKEGK